MITYVADVGATVPLILFLIRQGDAGGLPGYLPTVGLRNPANLAQYIDWADGTFKTVGWTLRDAPLVDQGAGLYSRPIDLSGVPTAVDGMTYMVEFKVDNGSDIRGTTYDQIMVTEDRTDMQFLRKLANNRLEELPGVGIAPGTMVLYDDDDTTVIRTWQLRDYQNNPTVGSPGAPAKRTRGV